MMQEEIFGLVLIIFVYDDVDFDKMLELVDSILLYVLMGFIFVCECSVVNYVMDKLSYVVGNFYINDKFMGVVVGQ